jgi:acid phosphatase (class A)
MQNLKKHMTKHIVLFVVLLAVANVKAQTPRALEAPRGYYQQLQKLSTAPAGKDLDIDKLKFVTEPSVIDRRLSLKPVFLTDSKVDDFVLPAMPANSSEQTKAEINYLLGLQANRTADDIERSKYMAGVYYNLHITSEDENYETYQRNLFFIGRSIGTWFNYKELPKTAQLMARVWRDASYFIWALKFKYARVRPYVLDEQLENLEETNWAAYPSGHASNSYINAFIYRELAPEYADVFMKDAYDMAHSREILGVHYPSDSESGRQFAHQFVTKLFQNPEFLKEFEEVKKEWKEKANETFARPAIKKKGEQKTSCTTRASFCSKTCN